MDSKTKAKILKQIKSGEVLAFSGRKVKIIAIVGNQVRCKKMNLTRECFGHLTVDSVRTYY